MRNKLAVIVIVGLALLAGLSSYFGRLWIASAIETGPQSFDVKAERVSLDTEKTDFNEVGELQYVAGWALTADHDSFGGFSGMVLSRDGKKLTAISDKGDWLTADLSVDAAEPLTSVSMVPFPRKAGGNTKKDFDAESLVEYKGGILVGFEQKHRLEEVSAPGTESRSSGFMAQTDFSGLSRNGGIEAMTLLQDGSLLMFAEKGLDQQGTLPAWIVTADGRQNLRFRPPMNYAPTDAKTLPNGDVALLLRYYSALDGVSVKLAILKNPADSGLLEGREIAHIAEPMTIDNMEALDYEVLADGTIRFFMLSDDNFSMRQQTLFMVFDWKGSNLNAR